ncbi:hypothetical protein AB0P41_13995 [Streptomyces sp. NPDC079167]|uniref:hypothetical protein n=1 Tax=Streptomyces sp. NPDC079167 TaxID=3154513 RepID=UPI00341DABA4
MQSQSASLDHLVQRGRALADCTQADVDAWYAGGCTGTAAIRQLALQAPAPVIARMLGHNDDHTTGSPKRPEELGVTMPPATTVGD